MKRGELDSRLLILVTMALVAFGLVMVYSATSAAAAVGGKDPNYYLKRQGMYAALGIVLDDARAAVGLPAASACSRPALGARLARAAGRRARDRPAGERCAALDLVRACGLPAVGAREARARDLGSGASSRAARRPGRSRSSGARSARSRRVFCVLLILEPDIGTAIALARDARRHAARRRHAGADARARDGASRRRSARRRSGSSPIDAPASSHSCTRGTTPRAPASRSCRR